MNVEIIGLIAGGLVSLSFLPQVIKSWKTKRTHDIAISLTIINFAGQVMWMVYGGFIGSFSLVLMSSISLVMVGSLLVLKLKYK